MGDSKLPNGPGPDRDPRTPVDRTKPPREWRSRPGGSNAKRAQVEPREASDIEGPSKTSATEAEASRSATRVPASTTPVPDPERAPHAPEEPASARPRGRTEPVPSAVTETADLPTRYGVDRLVLLIRDPHWCYAWWEITDACLQTGRRELAEPTQLTLRFYDISAIDWDGGNHHAVHDIEIHDAAGSWYVELGRPGAGFVAEVGWRAADGVFRPLVRSNSVALPRESMSPVVDENWMVLEQEYRQLFELAGAGSGTRSSVELLRTLEERLRRELLSGGVSSFGVSSFATRRER
ncbi:MAG: DUF4912 domain-containing protein [Candidatus Latescibacterota bacterium]|nr:MAG: DUF4912 domain-containing protein [Candidatus Latescibacterota bacterium]